MNLKSILAFGLGVFAFASINAQQVKTPKPSPYSTMSQAVGLNEVKVTYSRPGMKGRTIYGDLVPYGKLWRTGANMATTIEVNGTFMINGNKLEKGIYSLFTIPGENEWEVILNKNEKAFTSDYKQEEDVFRFKTTPAKISDKVETFTLLFSNVKDGSADLDILWENTKVTLNFTVDVDKMVMDQIDKTMKGVSARDLYLSASYYYDNNKDINKAVEWINKSVEMDGDKPKFWVVHLQAKILAKSGDKKGAIKAAEKSKELSIEAKYDSYVKKNDDLIQSLK